MINFFPEHKSVGPGMIINAVSAKRVYESIASWDICTPLLPLSSSSIGFLMTRNEIALIESPAKRFNTPRMQSPIARDSRSSCAIVSCINRKENMMDMRTESRNIIKKRKSGCAVENVRNMNPSIPGVPARVESHILPAKCSFAYCSHACLSQIEESRTAEWGGETNLRRLAHFLPYDLPFTRLVFFNGSQQSSTLPVDISMARYVGDAGGKPHPLQSRHSAYPGM